MLGTRGYCRELAATLLAAARDGTAHSWHTRHLCALLLEHLARRLPATLDDEHLELFAGLGLLDAAGSRLRQEVLREGFSSLSPASFAAEFARRLARNGPLHQSLERSPDSVVALRRLLVLSFQECRVLLARYLIEPQEVVERFLQEVRSGLASVSPALILNTQSIAEADHLRRRLPELEAEIVRQLVERNETFWVSERPRQMLNSMIE